MNDAENPRYDVTLRFYSYPEPDFIDTGRQRVVIISQATEDGLFFAGERLEYGRMGEAGLGLVKPLYDKLAAKVLKAGASRDKQVRDHFTLSGTSYAKVVEVEQFWAEFHQELADLGKAAIAQADTTEPADEKPAEKPAKPAKPDNPGRRRRRRKA